MPTENINAYPRPFTAWWALSLIFVAAIISYSDRQVLSLLAEPLRRDLGIGDVGLSLLMGPAFAFIYAIAGIPLGILADRTSRRNLIVVGMVLWSVATVYCGCARSFGQLFVGRVAVGLGEAVLSPAALSLIGDFFPARRRGTALGIYFTGITLGFGCAVIIGGAMLSATDSGLLSNTPLASLPPWRSVLILIGLPGIVWSLLMMTLREPPRRDVYEAYRTIGDSSASSEIDVATRWKTAPAAGRVNAKQILLKNIRLVPLFVTVAMASLVENAIASWSPSLLMRNFHREAAQVGITLGIVFMSGGSAGMLCGGWLSDQAQRRWGLAGRLRLCLAAACLGVATVMMINSSRMTIVVAVILVAVIASALITSSGLAAILDSVPNHRRGTATSISFFLNVAVGLGIGPTAVALLARFAFSDRMDLTPALLLVGALGYAIAAGGAWVTIALLGDSGEAISVREGA